jgi:hypothetical protein
VSATWLEAYDSRVYDLLGAEAPGGAARGRAGDAPRAGMVPLAIRETAEGDVVAAGAAEEAVRTTGGLLALIARGSGRRVTCATGMHDDSSRSHALLTLRVRRRWTAPSGACLVRSASLLLIDLAGSESTERAHGGAADRPGCAINVGLLVLGRVLTALAEASPTAAPPFRDSPLTRLMAPALAGACRTWLLATLSPDPSDAGDSAATLRFAGRAARITTAATAGRTVEWVDPAPDPMAGDVRDPDAALGRRTAWITTAGFGDVYARVAGDPADPLILYVHGSGPRNSSLQWNFLVPQLRGAGFYHVAIDCCGYGRSPGDRQAIRSYPGALIRDVVRALGKTVAYALVGSSQGACAVLNAALSEPDIAHFIAVCHPVGHNPARYTAISQPTLLAFDTEDAGHPVAVGRIMRRHLPRPHYFEFVGSEAPGWLEEHFADELRAMFASYPAPRNARGASAKLPDLSRLAGGLRAWATPADNEEAGNAVHVPELGGGDAPPPPPGAGAARRHVIVEVEEPSDGAAPPTPPSVAARGAGPPAPGAAAAGHWRAEMDAGGGVWYVNGASGERSRVRPAGVRIAAAAGARAAGAASDEEEDGPVTEHGIARAAAARAEAAAAAAAAELERWACSRCEHVLVQPMELSPCGHIQVRLIHACACACACVYLHACVSHRRITRVVARVPPAPAVRAVRLPLCAVPPPLRRLRRRCHGDAPRVRGADCTHRGAARCGGA